MEVGNRDFIVFSFWLLKLLLDLAALSGYDQFHETFRHTGLESFGVTLLEAIHISSGDSPIFAVREHKRESLARAGQQAPADKIEIFACPIPCMKEML